MSLLDVFKRREKREIRHSFDDDDREASKQSRLMQQQLKQMQFEMQQIQLQRKLEIERAELERIRDELRGDDEEHEERGGIQELMMMALLKNLSPPGQVAEFSPAPMVPNSTPTTPPPSFIKYTDEEIMDILDKLPKHQRKMLDIAPESLLRAKMREMFNADEDSISRAVGIIKS